MLRLLAAPSLTVHLIICHQLLTATAAAACCLQVLRYRNGQKVCVCVRACVCVYVSGGVGGVSFQCFLPA